MPKAEQNDLFGSAPPPREKLGAQEALACLRLIRSENVGPITFRQLIRHYGSASRALEALPEASRRGGRRGDIRIFPLTAAETELNEAERAGARPLFAIEAGYPQALAATDAPPPMIYVKGDASLLARPAVAIVGSRMCSAAGVKVSQLFARHIGEAGYVIVSGLARGIDGAAHEAALASGTAAVLAGGIDVVYPPEHDALQQRIAEQGCLVTEMPPGFRPRGTDFPRRNRIVSGLALGVVVVEAAARSGTLTTARYAGEQGREVFAVPGHALDPRAEGTNRLIQSGATLVIKPEDVIEALRPMTGLSEARLMAWADAVEPVSRAAPGPVDIGEGERAAVLAVLGPAPTEIDAIARATGLASRQVQIALIELDLAGRIERQGHGLVALKE